MYNTDENIITNNNNGIIKFQTYLYTPIFGKIVLVLTRVQDKHYIS